MGLLDSFMPQGYGVPNGGLPDGGYGSTPMSTGYNTGMQGLLQGNNPLFNIGMGILANNYGHYGAFSPAIGRGVQQGIQDTQTANQLVQKKQMSDMQLKKAQQDNDEYQRRMQALQAFKTQFPDYGVAVDLDPSLAIKAAYPNLAAKGADPYYQFLPTAGGYVAGNARTGKAELVTDANGQPYVKSTDSPQVRGAVKSAEAQAAAAFKPNTDVNGLLSTDEQVARSVYGNQPMPYQATVPANQLPTNNFSTPYPVTFGAPGTTATDQREGTNTEASVSLRNPANPNRPTGIKIPTKAEQAAAVKEAEMRTESATKKETTMAGVGDVIDQARSVLTGRTPPTHSGIGSVYDAAASAIGYAPQGAKEADALKAIGGQLVSKMPRMEGPQSNFDVQNYKEMAGDVGNPNIPIERRLSALNAMENIVRKYDKTSAPQAMQPPQGAINMLKLSPSKYRADFDAKYGAGASARILGK